MMFFSCGVETEFQSTPSARRATQPEGDRRHHEAISIHALREEGDERLLRASQALAISIHALREEGDENRGGRCCGPSYFNPRPPRGGRPFPSTSDSMPCRFQSTPSARRATVDAGKATIMANLFQSTPSARRATSSFPSALEPLKHFNPRPPRGGRLVDLLAGHALRQFQSTPSARRATLSCTRGS